MIDNVLARITRKCAKAKRDIDAQKRIHLTYRICGKCGRRFQPDGGFECPACRRSQKMY